MTSRMKVCFWLNMPSHYQREFLRAVQGRIETEVRYFGRIPQTRLNMGWAHPDDMEPWERYHDVRDGPESSLVGWTDYLHVIPGTVGDRFLMRMVNQLVRANVQWVHWSEHVQPGWRATVRLPLRMLYAAKISRHALGALAISRLAHDDFVRWGIPRHKILFQPYAMNPLEPSRKVEEADESEHTGRPVFLYCGTLSHRKAIDVLLRAFAKIDSEKYPARLVLVGPDGTGDNHFEKLAATLRIHDRVRFLGPLPASRVADVMQSADVVVLPSRHDGWGMVVYEGASLGKALIVSDACGSAGHLVVPEWNGYVIEAGSVESCHAALLNYCQNPAWGRLHGTRSALLAQAFDADAIAGLFVENIQTLCDRAKF